MHKLAVLFQSEINGGSENQSSLFVDTVLVKRKLVYNLDRTFCRISGSHK